VQQLSDASFVKPRKNYLLHMTLCFTKVQVKVLYPRGDKYIEESGCYLKERRTFKACMECI